MSRLLLVLALIASNDGIAASASSQFSQSMQAKRKALVKKTNYLSYLAVAGAIAIPAFVTGEFMMHVSFFKALYEWVTHGRSARSYFSKNPAGALYCATVTIRDFYNYPVTFFTAPEPSDLIKQVETFLKTTIPKDKLLVRIMIEPMIATKQGKKIMLAPLYCLWDGTKGITHDLEKKLYLTKSTNADNVFEALKVFTIGSLLSAQFIVVPYVYRYCRTLLLKK